MPSTELYTLSLHDALPISATSLQCIRRRWRCASNRESSSRRSQSGHRRTTEAQLTSAADRKSTRLNSSHVSISYAVFCLKKKNNDAIPVRQNHLHNHPYAT